MKIITVYTQPGCQPCKAVKRWLDRRDIDYSTVDLAQSPADLEAVKALGYNSAPVVIVSNGEAETDLHWYGFNTDYLQRYCMEQEAA